MPKIININENLVEIADNGQLHTVDKELLNFTPRINDFVSILKNQDGSIGKVVLSSTSSTNETQKNESTAIGTLSVIFGSLGFYPLIFIGSIAGLILALVGMNSGNVKVKNRSKIGLGLSVGSFGFWVLLMIIIAASYW